jgi:DNA-directed RNA polymerase specialized sigma subunit
VKGIIRMPKKKVYEMCCEKDSWRYLSYDTWVFDKALSYNPEDEWIDAIDGNTEEAAPFPFCAVDLIDRVLSKREARIVYQVLWDGKSLSHIGEEMGISKQRVHQLYNRALQNLKEELTQTGEE